MNANAEWYHGGRDVPGRRVVRFGWRLRWACRSGGMLMSDVSVIGTGAMGSALVEAPASTPTTVQ